jgi:hypothetical protein
MQAVLSQHHHGAMIGPPDNKFVFRFTKESEAEVIAIIWWQTSPYIRRRISEKSRTYPSSLLNALIEVACPFRFSDLPPEVRLRIYKMIPSSKQSVVTLTDDPPKHTRNIENRRSFLCINRQIRAEALPTYHQGRCFHTIWPSPTTIPNEGRESPRRSGKDIVTSINQWASTLRSDSLRSLRHLRIGGASLDPVLGFSLHRIGDKYRITCRDYMSLQSEAQLNLLEHAAAAASDTAQTLRLEGEALILASTIRPKMRDHLKMIR